MSRKIMKKIFVHKGLINLDNEACTVFLSFNGVRPFHFRTEVKAMVKYRCNETNGRSEFSGDSQSTQQHFDESY